MTKRNSKNLELLSHIVPGQMVDLEILTPTNSKRIKTEFIGLLKDKFVIFNYPALKRLPTAADYLREGVVIIVRALLGKGEGQVVAFRQTVKSLASHPERMIYLDYPSKLESYSLRAETRIPTLLAAKLQLNNDSAVQGVIRDISQTGAMFDIKGKAEFNGETGAECTITLEENELLKGIIRSKKPTVEGIQLGLQLLNDEKEITQLMKKHLIDLSILESEK